MSSQWTVRWECVCGFISRWWTQTDNHNSQCCHYCSGSSIEVMSRCPFWKAADIYTIVRKTETLILQWHITNHNASCNIMKVAYTVLYIKYKQQESPKQPWVISGSTRTHFNCELAEMFLFIPCTLRAPATTAVKCAQPCAESGPWPETVWLLLWKLW